MIDMHQFVELVRAHVPGLPRGVLEVGAHDGADCAALCVGLGVPGLAVEGDPEFFEAMPHATLAAHGVRTVRAVIAAEAVDVTWYRQSGLLKASGIYDRELGPTAFAATGARLDAVLALFPDLVPSVLKVDVEGATWDALVSLGDRIADVQAAHVETETTEYFRGQRLEPWVDAFFARHAFRRIAREGGPGQWDAVFVRGSAR